MFIKRKHKGYLLMNGKPIDLFSYTESLEETLDIRYKTQGIRKKIKVNDYTPANCMTT
jgi:hypothetical protein